MPGQQRFDIALKGAGGRAVGCRRRVGESRGCQSSTAALAVAPWSRTLKRCCNLGGFRPAAFAAVQRVRPVRARETLPGRRGAAQEFESSGDCSAFLGESNKRLRRKDELASHAGWWLLSRNVVEVGISLEVGWGAGVQLRRCASRLQLAFNASLQNSGSLSRLMAKQCDRSIAGFIYLLLKSCFILSPRPPHLYHTETLIWIYLVRFGDSSRAFVRCRHSGGLNRTLFPLSGGAYPLGRVTLLSGGRRPGRETAVMWFPCQPRRSRERSASRNLAECFDR